MDFDSAMKKADEALFRSVGDSWTVADKSVNAVPVTDSVEHPSGWSTEYTLVLREPDAVGVSVGDIAVGGNGKRYKVASIPEPVNHLVYIELEKASDLPGTNSVDNRRATVGYRRG